MRRWCFSGIVATIVLISAIGVPSVVRAETLQQSIDAQAGQASTSAGYSAVLAEGGIQSTIAKIVNAALGLLGAMFFGLMVYAGYLWMTSRDESEQVDKAKETMRRAVIGLIIVLAAYAISKFITVAIQQGTSG